MSPEDQEALLYTVQDFLPIMMFLTLAVLLFSGFPVAFILGGIAFLFGLIGYFLDVFSLIEFFNFMPRIWFQGAENLVLVAIPGFVFMGVMMERGGIAEDLLYCVQVLLKGVAGSLAIAVTIMGTILAAMTGIIGASVTMMTALALPTMLRQGYSHSLSCGVIAASGTLGILIPPSIMLIIMADL
ncbi:MAG: TRAP transporter large permease subunit, partial [Proteobacteria bacterium]|nr:TRAP transporter large permease subunit [Pseudomonadota bacterium]